MKVTETLNEGFERVIQVDVSAKTLAEKLEEKLKEAKGRVRLNGFRPGKVPEKHLRQLYGKSFMAEIINEIIQEKSHTVLQERNERSVAHPQVDLTDNEEEIEKILNGQADLSFLLKYEVLPTVEVKDLEKLHVVREIAKIDPKDIDKQVEEVLSSTRTFTPKEGAAKDGDRVIIDYVGMLDGKPFENGADKDAHLILGSKKFIPGFEEQLIGIKAGDKKLINVVFPAEYPAAHLAGKEVQFDILLKEVAKAAPIEINDDSAKKLGVESLEKLKSLIQERMESQYGTFTRQKVKRQILDALDKDYKFAVPHSLVHKEFDNIWEQVQHELAHEGKTFADEGTTEEEAKKEYHDVAERRVRLGLVIAAIGEKAGIDVSQQEVETALIQQVRHYPGQEKEIMDFYQKNPAALANLRAPLFEEKVIDYLLGIIKVSDKTVSPEELMKEEEETGKEASKKSSEKKTEEKKKEKPKAKASKSKKTEEKA